MEEIWKEALEYSFTVKVKSSPLQITPQFSENEVAVLLSNAFDFSVGKTNVADDGSIKSSERQVLSKEINDQAIQVAKIVKVKEVEQARLNAQKREQKRLQKELENLIVTPELSQTIKSFLLDLTVVLFITVAISGLVFFLLDSSRISYVIEGKAFSKIDILLIFTYFVSLLPLCAVFNSLLCLYRTKKASNQNLFRTWGQKKSNIYISDITGKSASKSQMFFRGLLSPISFVCFGVFLPLLGKRTLADVASGTIKRSSVLLEED
jgi:hypothetical protein